MAEKQQAHAARQRPAADGNNGGRVRTPFARLRAPSAKVPLDTLLANMRFWHHRAQALAARLEYMVLDKFNPEQDREIASVAKEIRHARVKAQRFAVAAAPYVHPKLKRVPMPRRRDEAEVITANFSPPPAAGRSGRDDSKGPDPVAMRCLY